MNQLKDVKRKARTLIGDPDGDFADDDYIMPFIEIAFTGAINYLTNTCSPFITKDVEVPAVAAGTQTFAPYQVAPRCGAEATGQSGAPLAGLLTPLRIWWKVGGQPANNYCEALEKKDLPFITPANYIAGQEVYWEWRANKIRVTPLNFIADFLVSGEFAPLPPVQDDDYLELDPLMEVGMAYSVAALIGGERVNATYIQNWTARAEQEWDNISSRLVRKELSTPQRIGRISGRNRRYGRC